MEQEIATYATSDPAAMAFDALRCEVITLRLAVQQLAAAQTQCETPDYTETLAEIRGSIQSLAHHYRKLSDASALCVTPDQLAVQINRASSDMRNAERQALQSAESSFVAIARELTGFVQSARSADRQNNWMLGFGAICFVTGGVMAWGISII